MTTNFTICSWEWKTIKMSTFFILILLSLVGNFLILAVFYRNKTLRTTVHYFIANAAVSDLMVPTIFLPARTSEIYHDGQWLVEGVLGNILCKIVWSALLLSSMISALSMTIIAVHRFYAIVFPLKGELVSKKNCFRLIIISWIVPVVVQAYRFCTIRVEEHQNTIHCNRGDHDGGIVSYYLLLSMFMLTAVIVTGLYSTIIIFLYRQQSRLHLASEATKLQAKENKKVTTMLIFLVVPFYLLWIPFLSKCKTADDDCLWSWITCQLPLWYTVVSPVVLFIFSKSFRQGCKEILNGFSLLCNSEGNVNENTSVSPQVPEEQ